MKRIMMLCGRIPRLCLMTIGLLFAQQSFAIGTPAGDSVSNQASVAYSVGGVVQNAVDSNIATFVVDQRVDFTLAEVDGIPTPVTPGLPNAVTAFTLTNTGNAVQDFNLSAVNLVGGTVNGNTDTAQVEDPPRVFADTNGSGVFDAGDDVFVDELSDIAGANSILVFVVANVPVTLPDGAGANVEITATAHDAGAAGLGAITTDDSGVADDTTLVQVVFANGNGGGVEVAQDGYAVASASLSATKGSAVIDDGFSVTDPKAIPGATIEYTVTILNTGAQDATGVGLVDPLDANVTIALGEYGGGDAEVDQGGALFDACTLDTDDVDADGCGVFTGVSGPEVRMTPAALTLGGTVSGTANDAVFRFRVTIN